MYLCVTCGTQHEGGNEPAHCLICEDERQYVGIEGQQWTTLAKIAETHKNTWVDLEPGLSTAFMSPKFAIGHRAFLIESRGGNVLWEVLPLLDDETVAAIHQKGGVSAIAISHPHYYTAMVEWSRALNNVPVYLHAADAQWIMRHDDCIQLWDGERRDLHDGITLTRGGGHFAGGTMLHWPAGGKGKGALLPGDIIQVVPDQRWVSFMYSYPNLIPLSAESATRVVKAVDDLEYDVVYGAFHPLTVARDGKAAVQRSLQRYLDALARGDR